MPSCSACGVRTGGAEGTGRRHRVHRTQPWTRQRRATHARRVRRCSWRGGSAGSSIASGSAITNGFRERTRSCRARCGAGRARGPCRPNRRRQLVVVPVGGTDVCVRRPRRRTRRMDSRGPSCATRPSTPLAGQPLSSATSTRRRPECRRMAAATRRLTGHLRVICLLQHSQRGAPDPVEAGRLERPDGTGSVRGGGSAGPVGD